MLTPLSKKTPKSYHLQMYMYAKNRKILQLHVVSYFGLVILLGFFTQMGRVMQ